MLTENDFFLKFEKYTNQELVKVKKDELNYNQEAINALDKLIEQRGGRDKLLIENEAIKKIQIETVRILLETEKLYNQKNNLETIKNIITSTLINNDKKNEIVVSEFTRLDIEKDDFITNPKSILKMISGVLISSFIGGCLFCCQMIFNYDLFYIFGFIMIFICYFNVKFFTDQIKINSILILATIITFFISLFIGQLLYTYYVRLGY